MRKLNENLLTYLSPFADLSMCERGEMLDQATLHRYGEGETVFHGGGDATRFFLLLEGYIRVLRVTPEGDYVTVLHIPSGELFGIAAALGQLQYPASAMTVADSVVLSWPTRLWTVFTEMYPGFATKTNAIIGQRMMEMHDQLVEMATQQVEQRLANALLRLITQTGRKTEAGIEVDFPITRQELSELTGSTLHTVSRLLTAWEKRGVVQSRRKYIVVCQPHELVMLAEGEGPR